VVIDGLDTESLPSFLELVDNYNLWVIADFVHETGCLCEAFDPRTGHIDNNKRAELQKEILPYYLQKIIFEEARKLWDDKLVIVPIWEKIDIYIQVMKELESSISQKSKMLDAKVNEIQKHPFYTSLTRHTSFETAIKKFRSLDKLSEDVRPYKKPMKNKMNQEDELALIFITAKSFSFFINIELETIKKGKALATKFIKKYKALKDTILEEAKEQNINRSYLHQLAPALNYDTIDICSIFHKEAPRDCFIRHLIKLYWINFHVIHPSIICEITSILFEDINIRTIYRFHTEMKPILVQSWSSSSHPAIKHLPY